MTRRTWLAAGLAHIARAELPDVTSVAPDLTIPPVSNGAPASGKRVRQTDPEFAHTGVHHMIYLPVDWRPGRHYPVIVEYAGNGDYQNYYGDVSTGEVEGSKLGYGISGGRGFIWVCLPFVDTIRGRNQTIWWGDVAATIRYARNTVERVCDRYYGDPEQVFIAGFSRGAIACNYIGLHDDEIAKLWLGFIPYSHYDGIADEALYPPADRGRALERLRRINGRASFVCQEGAVYARQWIQASGVQAPFTYQAIGFRNHNDAWTLRDVPERRALRQWIEEVRRTRPGR